MPLVKCEEPGDRGGEDGAFDGVADLVPGEAAVPDGRDDEVEGGVEDGPERPECPGRFGLHRGPWGSDVAVIPDGRRANNLHGSFAHVSTALRSSALDAN